MIAIIQDIIDDKKCFDIIREKRWSNGVRCKSDSICKNGHHKGQNIVVYINVKIVASILMI